MYKKTNLLWPRPCLCAHVKERDGNKEKVIMCVWVSDTNVCEAVPVRQCLQQQSGEMLFNNCCESSSKNNSQRGEMRSQTVSEKVTDHFYSPWKVALKSLEHVQRGKRREQHVSNYTVTGQYRGHVRTQEQQTVNTTRQVMNCYYSPVATTMSTLSL